MTLTQQVAGLVIEAGRGTAESLGQSCPELSRAQVVRALRHAAACGLIELVGYEFMPKGVGCTRLCIYAPTTNARRAPRVASVWELGSVA